MKPSATDRLKIGIFCTESDEAEQLLNRLSFVTLVKIKRFSIKSISKLDVIFVDARYFAIKSSKTIDTPVIFLAKNKSHAYDALKYGVIDMIIQPYQLEDFEKAILKAVEFLKLKHLRKVVKTNTNRTYPNIKGLFFECKGLKQNIVSLDFRKIRLFTADGHLTHILLENNRKEMGSFPLYHFESVALAHGFVRVHRKYLVNLAFVEKIVAAGNGKKSIRLKDSDMEIPIARRRWKVLHKLFI